MDLVALLPWDDPVRGIASAFRDEPPWSYVTEPVRQVRAPVPMRVDARGGLHLLSASHEMVHLDADGAIRARTPLPHLRVTDFACDAAGSCILLGEGRLVRLDAAGRTLWSRQVGERFSNVLLDEQTNQVYLRVHHTPELVALDGGTLRLHEQGGQAFIAAGKLGYTFYDEERNARGIRVTDLRNGRTETLPGEDEHYAWLVHPFGMDARSRLYVWNDGRIARVALDGTVEELGAAEDAEAPFESWQVDPRGGVVVRVTMPEGLALRRFLKPDP